MNIPDKAIEVAWGAADSHPELDRVQAILDAAAPYIAAQALWDYMSDNEGERVRKKTNYGYFEETMYTRDSLVKRADELEGK